MIRGETGNQARGYYGFMTRPMVDKLGDMATPVESDNKQLNRLFQIRAPGAPKEEPLPEGAPPDTGPSTLKKKLMVGTSNFATQEALSKVVADANLPPGYEFRGQNFRHISFTTQGAAANINKIVKNNMLDIGDGWYLAKEQDPRLMTGEVTDAGGLYVMAKKVGGPAKVRAGAPVGNEADQWLIFKTDEPGFFKPEEERFNQAVGQQAFDPMQNPETIKDIQSHPLFQLAYQIKQSFPVRTFQTGSQGLLGLGPKSVPAA
jgi:hypothetical protein